MSRFSANEYVMSEMYLRRPKLKETELMAVRVRVAIKCVDRLYHAVEWIIDEKGFPDYGIRLLNQMINRQQPHPLDEEIRDVLHAWQRGESYDAVYYRAAQLQAARVVRRVRYGGRRGR